MLCGSNKISKNIHFLGDYVKFDIYHLELFSYSVFFSTSAGSPAHSFGSYCLPQQGDIDHRLWWSSLL